MFVFLLVIIKEISIRWVTETEMELSLTNGEKRTIELTEANGCLWNGIIKEEEDSDAVVVGCMNRGLLEQPILKTIQHK